MIHPFKGLAVVILLCTQGILCLHVCILHEEFEFALWVSPFVLQSGNHYVNSRLWIIPVPQCSQVLGRGQWSFCTFFISFFFFHSSFLYYSFPCNSLYFGIYTNVFKKCWNFKCKPGLQINVYLIYLMNSVFLSAVKKKGHWKKGEKGLLPPVERDDHSYRERRYTTDLTRHTSRRAARQTAMQGELSTMLKLVLGSLHSVSFGFVRFSVSFLGFSPKRHLSDLATWTTLTLIVTHFWEE